MMFETRKILGDESIAINVTCARVPVRNCHSESVTLQTREPLSVEDARALLSGMAGLTVVAPADQAVVDSTIVFQWRSGAPDATYRVTVQDRSGAVVWDTTLADTAVALPRRVVLAKGQYFWSLDAQLVDGGSAKAGAHRFTVR